MAASVAMGLAKAFPLRVDQAGGDGEQGERGPRGPHPRRLGGVPGGSGVVSRAKDGERPLIDQAVAGNSPVYGPGWEIPIVIAQGVAGKPGLFLPGRTVYFCPFQPGVQQDDALRLRQGLGERAGGQESGPAGGAAGPRRLPAAESAAAPPAGALHRRHRLDTGVGPERSQEAAPHGEADLRAAAGRVWVRRPVHHRPGKRRRITTGSHRTTGEAPVLETQTYRQGTPPCVKEPAPRPGTGPSPD